MKTELISDVRLFVAFCFTYFIVGQVVKGRSKHICVAHMFRSVNSPEDQFFYIIKIISGSFAFPWLRKTFDGCRITGLIGFSALNLALAPSIVSIWLPGSPFDPFYLAKAVSTGSAAVALSPSSNGTSATDVSLDDKCQYQPLTSVIVFLASIIAGK